MSKNVIELFEDKINLAGHTFILERVKNLDDLVDQVSDELFAEDERLPYWAELWPSAQALAEYLLLNKDKVQNKDILELGCGLGLTSIALSLSNPRSLVVTDYENDALLSTYKNFELNNLKPPEMQILDWRTPDPGKKYDIIVASDVVYERRFFEPLINLFKTYLRKDGQIILAEPNRNIARSFFGKLLLSGFYYSVFDKYVTQLKKNVKISIYSIKFK